MQGGLVLVWLYFMDVRHTKNFHAVLPSWLLPLLKKFLNVYFFSREIEKDSVSRGGAERERETESEVGPRL